MQPTTPNAPLFSVRPAREYSLLAKIKGHDRYGASLALRPDGEQRPAKVFSRFPQEFERIAVVMPQEKRRLPWPHAQRQHAILSNDVYVAEIFVGIGAEIACRGQGGQLSRPEGKIAPKSCHTPSDLR